ncbi:hypothetical protein, partial [Klebsiella variicola]|uniref:hypothetical protein n=1 Tax=Klebsiella variicola TaxID=244366 RepID=UPI0039C46017
ARIWPATLVCSEVSWDMARDRSCDRGGKDTRKVWIIEGSNTSGPQRTNLYLHYLKYKNIIEDPS